MSQVLSKLTDRLLNYEWSFPYNCYEVGHGWTPYCTGAALELGWAGFKNSLPLYTSLYLFTQLGISRKYDLGSFYETFKSILTSTSFLGFHFMSGIVISCVLRNNASRYYYNVQVFWPGFISACLAILIERPSRRAALAFYMANMSTELAFKLLCSLGYLRPIPHGETLIFSIGLAGLYYFNRINGFGHDPVSLGIKYFVGPLEAKSRSKKLISDTTTTLSSNEQTKKVSTRSQTPSIVLSFQNQVTYLFNLFFSKHQACPHKDISCAQYTISPFVTRFAIGYLIKSLLGVAGAYRTILKQPGEAFRKAFTNRSSVNFGLFLGSLVSLLRGLNCTLRRWSGKNEDWHCLVTGFLAGSSMLFAPRASIATYVIWKCFEQYYFHAAKIGKVKHVEPTVVLIYAFSVAVLLYTFALEPRFIRPSYMKFIDRISDHKLHQVNRMGKINIII